MGSPPLRLGTRGSQLAMWQARAVAARISEHGGRTCRIVVIKTSGDRLQDAPLAEAGGKRLFVKEIEDALLGNEIDLAVHSSKDLPARLPDGLVIGGVLPREDPRDAIVLPAGHRRSGIRDRGSGIGDRENEREGEEALEELVARLGPSPSFGTGSVRRVSQLKRMTPEARFQLVRGNLDTRLRKLDEGQHDALVLAAAGLRRLGLESRISLALPPAVCMPAPGQGIVAVEVRAGDRDVQLYLAPIDDPDAAAALAAERAVVDALGGGCQTPIGALASTSGQRLNLQAVVVAVDGSRIVRASVRGGRHEAAALGARVGQQPIADGAAEILEEAMAIRDSTMRTSPQS